MSAEKKPGWEKPELIVLARSKPEEAVLCGCKTTNSTIVGTDSFRHRRGGGSWWGGWGGGGYSNEPQAVFSACYSKQSTNCNTCLQNLSS